MEINTRQAKKIVKKSGGVRETVYKRASTHETSPMAATAIAPLLKNLCRSFLRQEWAGVTDAELLSRFLKDHNEAAFAALLYRHGPMVLSVCRRVLQNDSDAEDAFQSTFFVLVRKAGSIRPQGMVGNWLHGVAHTTALKARAMRARRVAKETAAATKAKADAGAASWNGLEERLDQELKSLPPKYRSAIVLCDLEGRSLQQAAAELGCPLGTVGTRLSRGRAMLARRLSRNGAAISAAALALALSQTAAAASVPGTLLMSTTEGASLLTAGAPTAGVISANVTGLTQSVLKTLLLAKLKLATALVMIPLLVGLAGLTLHADASPPHDSAQSAPEPAASAKSNIANVASKIDHGLLSEVDGTQTLPAELQAQPQVDLPRSASLPRVEQRETTSTVRLPPGLARKAANHPGRVAWLKAHPNGKLP
jgi:RNA polymerase sigma factor (sigma-70 family)